MASMAFTASLITWSDASSDAAMAWYSLATGTLHYQERRGKSRFFVKSDETR